MELPRDCGGGWIPVKPVPVKRPAPEPAPAGGGDRPPRIPWTVPSGAQLAALGSASHGQAGGREEVKAFVLRNPGAAGQAPSYKRLLAINDPEIARRMKLAPVMVARIASGSGGGGADENAESSKQSPLLSRGKFKLPVNGERGSGVRLLPVLAPKPVYRPSSPSLPILNGTPENNNIASRSISEGMPPPAIHATMENNQMATIQERPPCEIFNFLGKPTSYQELLRAELSKAQQPIANNPVEHSLSSQVESSQIAGSQSQEGETNVVVDSADGLTIQEHEGENIDLNKTPPQKTKRKKHRPKVIREGKSAKTQKAANAKLQPPKTEETPTGKRKYVRRKKDTNMPEITTNPQEASPKSAVGEVIDQDCGRMMTTETPTGKRKYVRRNKETNTPETTTNPQETSPKSAAGEVVDQQSRRRNKPVRRSLKFDLERPREADQLPGSAQGQENQATETVHGSHAILEDMTSTRGVGFDLNSVTNQSKNENIRIPQTPTQPPQPSRDEIMKAKLQQDYQLMARNMSQSPSQQPEKREGENLKKLARMINCRASSSTNSALLQQGEKRDYKLIDNAESPADNSDMDTYSDIHKRRRKENSQGELTANAFALTASAPCSGRSDISSMQRSSTYFTFADAQRFLQRWQSSQVMIDFNQVKPQTNTELVQGHRGSNPMKLDSIQLPTPKMAPETIGGQETASYGPKARVDVLITQQKTKRDRRQKKMEESSLSSMHTNSNQVKHIVSAYQVGSTSSSYDCGIRPAQVTYENTVEGIVQRLSLLNLYVTRREVVAQPHNALVPYFGGSGAMVPFEGPFEFIKRRKPRPKVDLDPESNRVWKLLMGKEEGEEGTGVDKEKWWEEERRIFRGRTDSFVARMRLIQGDRRFSPWKGSVVDSVIGVYLTQNVSDHLSSSAFMCLAAKFPLRSKENAKTADGESISRPVVINDGGNGQGEVLEQEFCYQNSAGINEYCKMENKGMANSNWSSESNIRGGSSDHELELQIGQESPDSNLDTAVTVTSCMSTVEGDDIASSQNSAVSSQNSTESPGQIADQHKLNPLLNFERDELLTGTTGNIFGSFRELLELANGRALNDLKAAGKRIMLENYGCIDWQGTLQADTSPLVPNAPAYLNGVGPSVHASNYHFHPLQSDFSSLSCAPSTSYCYDTNQSYLHHSGLNVHGMSTNETECRQYSLWSESSTNFVHQKEQSVASGAPGLDSFWPISKNPTQLSPLESERNSCSPNENSFMNNATGSCSNKQDGIQTEQTIKAAELQVENQNHNTPQPCSNSQTDSRRNNSDLVGGDAAEKIMINDAPETEKSSAERLNHASKEKKTKSESQKKKPSFDWDSLRRQACPNGKKERSRDRADSLDYEALRNADVNEISNAIRERGMNNMLAGRMQDFLNRLVRDHGSIDLEWLRDVPPEKAKDYLLSIRGLGLKSVECVRLLTLHHLAFPVDTNVGRICVRLGWVPLQPLPESLQLHLLEMYPVLETIQKYLWPRLCKLDQETLYELHYQLITFGKVFCTKSKPNCNACPMRGECKHFASAFASARLALPGPEEKRLVPSEVPLASEPSHGLFSNSMPPLALKEGTKLSQDQTVPKICQPIIEEPATPEPESFEASEIDIEDAFYNDPDEIPTIKLNFEEFTQNLQSYMQENNMGLQEGDMSKALVAITPEAASIPMPKLKNVSRLRTEHLVYQLPDSHPLMEGLDKREPDDPCPYLLAIWTPGETAQSTEPPTACCSYQETGKMCNRKTCFSCNSVREAQAQTVRGTILIPCRTANRGSFPLNGTYFQVNEVFADHDTSRNPIDVPRDWIWNLPRRTVYFGTSTPSIFKGLTTEQIQHCFWRGFVCVRGFDRTSRAPRPLFARLHLAASKVTKNKKTAAAAAAGGDERWSVNEEKAKQNT